jgi:hypothetical protein
MRTPLQACLLVILVGTQICKAQNTKDEDSGVAASSNIPGAEYPKIHADLRVSFRLKAPDAQKVRLHLDKDYDLERDTNGVWSVTTTPQVPGFHYYWFLLDGVNVCDPGSETFFGVGRLSSGLEVPSKGEEFYNPKDVPHGDVRSKWYFSKITGKWRRCFVYTPPDYDTNPAARYPVLYLQPGFGEDERGWAVQGRVNFILDNLIATGAAKPMLAVMDNQFSALKPGRGAVCFRRTSRGTGKPSRFR